MTSCCPTCNRPLLRALGGYSVDLSYNRLLYNGAPLGEPLTRAEADLLAALIAAKGNVLARDQLIGALYGQALRFCDERTIDTHIKRLRKKLHGISLKVETVYGRGYFVEVSS
ncbi:MAG TPA: winged helix-turn-helix domain-containing protein [Beijerinckiaceae bacterium]|jgi:DNA-binding response OmpR family regulator|nr:winged helix-turn-helix domain-containing protein [Beijerinckiaceae bacterium]